MFRHIFLAAVLLIIKHTVISQSTMKVKFKDIVFGDVTIKRDIAYYTTADASVKSKYYLMDLYEPAGDLSEARPLIIWMHGGGFKYGNKKTGGIPLWSKNFAQLGYVCVSINHRLSKKKPLRRFHDLVEGCMDAAEDLQKAIIFLKKNCREYRIDTTRIIVGGNSAGAMTGLHAVYSSPYEMMQLINQPGYDSLNKTHNPQKICAIISFWGALFDTNWLKNEKVPVVCAHGTKDKVVPFDHKGPVNGSLAIHRHADSLNIPNDLKLFPGYGHELQKHFNPLFSGKKTKRRWKEAGKFAAGFLYKELFSK
jgi:predicted esterase